ncbi:MAG: RHS repeat domain-containing protein [Candidatus Angelobacter sp.]
MKYLRLCWFILGALVLSSCPVAGQVSTGAQPMGSFSSGPDVINLGNLNMHFDFPVFAKPGRGMPFTYTLSFDSSVWSPVTVSGVKSWQPAANWNWRGVTEVATGYISRMRTTVQCQLPDFFPPRYVNDPYWYNFQYHDQFGVVHSFDNTVGGCPGDFTDNVSSSTDSSGLTLDTTSTPKIIARDGTTFTPPLDGGVGAGTRTDRNGNQISTATGNSFTDTLGITALTVSGGAPSPQIFTYTTTTGTAASVTINYASYTVQTNFGCSGTNEFPATAASLVSSVVYPDGSTFSFTYEPTPGNGAAVTARVKSITLPTGATITYTYTAGSNGITCADGSAAGLTRVTTDGTTTYARSNSGTAWTTTFTDAATPGNQTVINFQTVGTPALFLETHRTMNQGASTVLLQTDTCYNGAVANCNATAVTLPITEIKKYVTLNNSQQSLSDTFINGVGLPREVDEYDFGASAHGALLKKTTISYASLGNGIGAMPLAVTVFDGGGNQKAQQTFRYDETVATATSGVPQHVAITGSRGNLTSVSQWVDTTGTNLTTTMAYEDTGNVLTSTDPGGHATQFSYADNFTDTVNRNSHAYVTQVTLPDTNSPILAHHLVKSQYDANTGRMMSAWDQNNAQTSFGYDSMLRTVQTNFPDGGQTTLVFDNFNKSHTETKIDGSRITYAYTLVDGYGRPSRSARTSGETTPYNQQDFCYNSNGQLSFQAYSYQGNGLSDPIVCSGAGDTFAYDGLGRITQVTHSDGSSAQLSYTGRATQIQDEGNGTFTVKRVQQSNALGQLTGVCEVTAVNLLGNGGTVGSCGLDIAATGFLTSYAYNTLGNLSQVTQGSLVNRSFSYDSLSRLTSESHPEWGSGAMTYSYSNADGLMSKRTRPAPNQTNSAVTVDTTYAYDELHRLRTKTYSDGVTPLATFNYDETAPLGFTAVNMLGRLSSEIAGNAKSAFSYDTVGRVLNNWQCIPRTCPTPSFYQLTYGYDLFGDVTSATNGAGVTFSYSYNTAPRLTGMTSNFVDTTHPATFLSNVHYGSFGVTGDTLGNGLIETFGYNTLGALQSYTTAPTTPYSFTLGFAADGNITSATDSVNGNWTYSYDQFNRLVGSTQGTNSQTYVYDRYGNRLQQGTSTYVFDTNNRIVGSGVTYDALGNVTNDGVHTYAYDAESRLTKVDGSASLVYQYDAEGRRVHTPNYESVYDLNGRATTLFNLSGVWAYGEIYAGGRHLATYSGATTTNFLHTDWLGTRRVMTNLTGAATDTCTGLPFGDGINCIGTEWNFNHFTDYVHDPESNLEHTLFRQYSSTQGRFLSPDPFTGSMDLGNPQSMNRYPYVAGNPINFTDPLGLDSGYVATACTLLSGNGDEAFGCADGSGFTTGDWGNLRTLLGGILHGGGLAGNSVPGNCFLPGACPSLPIPSILSLLPALPWNNPCIGSPVSDACGFGNGFRDVPFTPWEHNTFNLPRDPFQNIFDHYCGPGGHPPPLGQLDVACKAHDECYDNNGLKITDNWDPRIILNPQKAAKLRACNQKLCDDARNSGDIRGNLVIWYFQAFSFAACKAPGIEL